MNRQNRPQYGILTGWSLSCCIMDILHGAVSLEQVSVIYSDALLYAKGDQQRIDDVIALYKEGYWDIDPGEGERLTRDLMRIGILRPAPETPQGFTNISSGHWSKEDGTFIRVEYPRKVR